MDRQLSEENTLLYEKYEKELELHVSQVSLIGEALKAVSRVRATICCLSDGLKNICLRWVLRRIFLARRYESFPAFIDGLGLRFNDLPEQFNKFQKVLEKIKGFPKDKREQVFSTWRFLGLGFDYQNEDVSVRRQVRANRKRLVELTGVLTEIDDLLQAKRLEVRESIDDIKRKQENLPAL